ncbi:MAG TPA: hypothetical protein VMT18_04505 [Planctomycetota bacterium]|nr:hypothetical protein [Planctomycetota bacterium]
MIALLALALCARAQEPPRPDEVVIHSRGNHFRAVLAKAPGQERVPDAIARWKLAVSDADGHLLWSAFHPAPGATQRFSLAQDASRFAVVDTRYGDGQAVVTLRRGEDVERVFGGQLGMDPAKVRALGSEGTWLADVEQPVRFAWMLGPFGPLQLLDLECFDGEVRRIDLASGLPLDAGGGRVPVRVEPVFVEESVPPSVVPVVTSATAPSEVFGDEGLVVTIHGQHPNPGWRIFAFGLEPGGPDGRTLVITPRAKPPMPGGLQVQKTEPFTVEATLRGLPPGEHMIQVQGQQGPAVEPLVVLVRTGGVLAMLGLSGGILGLDERITLFENGTIAIESNRPQRESLHFAAPRAFAAARTALSSLPPIPPGPGAVGSDFMHYELTWKSGERWHTLTGDDGNVRGELRRAIDAVAAVAQGG